MLLNISGGLQRITSLRVLVFTYIFYSKILGHFFIFNIQYLLWIIVFLNSMCILRRNSQYFNILHILLLRTY